MKTFYFWEKDNIYKIFQLIDKLPKKYKEVIFDIDPRNDFFTNKWWLKLVLEKWQDKWIKIIFVIENEKQEQLMKIFNANYIWKKVPVFVKIKKTISNFLLTFKSEHSFYQKHYNFFKILFLIFEIWFVLFAVYFIYNVITPKTDIYIQPAVKLKHLIDKFYVYPESEKNKFNINWKYSLAYKKETFQKTYTVNIPVSDITYIAKPAWWKIKFINTTLNWISLKSNTLLTTANWLLFRIKNWVYIPPKNKNWDPWVAYVLAKAEQKDKSWKLIWSRWNLLEGTKLYVKKLYSSFGQKKIYAQVYKDFVWWKTRTNWNVQLKDIETLKKILLNTVKQNYKDAILKYNSLKNNSAMILFAKWLFWYKDVKYHIYSRVWEKTAYLKWDVVVNVYYSYISKKDLLKYFKTYLNEHIVSIKEFIWWDESSLSILKVQNVSNWLYILTIWVDAILWYDFDKDYNDIVWQIVSRVRWLEISKAKNMILWFQEIAWVDIKTTNTLNRVSKLKSRIYIHIVK